MAVGAIMMGMEILNPSTVVVVSTLDTSMSMRGRNLKNQGQVAATRIKYFQRHFRVLNKGENT